MARIRSLKPGFFTNEHLAELSPWHRLCYAGLWVLADREGRLEDRPKRIKTDIFPYDDIDLDDLLWGLARYGFIVRYIGNGQPLIAIPTWNDHQHPRQDEAESRIVPYESGSDRSPNDTEANYPKAKGLSQVDADPSLQRNVAATPARMGSGVLDLGSGNLINGKRADEPALNSARAQDFLDLWNEVTKPPIPRCHELPDERRRKIRARLAKRPFAEWREVFEAIQANPFCRGENDRGWTADIDWILKNDTNAAKALERYRTNRAPAVRQQAGCEHTPPCPAGTTAYNCHKRTVLEEGRTRS